MDEGSYPIIIACLCIVIAILVIIIAVNYYLQKKRSKSIIETINSTNRDFTEEDIISIVQEGHEQGVIDESEVEMIHNIFELDETEAKEIMTHRKNMICVDGELSFNDVIEFVVETGRSRYPVYDEDKDHIIGVLLIKDLLAYSKKNEIFRTSIKDIKGLIREVDFVPETLGVNDLFKSMQKSKNHMAMVVDEYGQISGLVSMEDILEEIVGNILDEHDTEQEMVVAGDDGTYTFDGLTSMEDVLEVLEIPVEEDSFETINGLVVSLLGHIPADNETATVYGYGYKFEILSSNDNMIQTVRVSKNEQKVEA